MYYFNYLNKSINKKSWLLGEVQDPIENKSFPIIIQLYNPKNNTYLFLNCINGQIYEDPGLNEATNYQCNPSFLLQRFILASDRMIPIASSNMELNFIKKFFKCAINLFTRLN